MEVHSTSDILFYRQMPLNFQILLDFTNADLLHGCNIIRYIPQAVSDRFNTTKESKMNPHYDKRAYLRDSYQRTVREPEIPFEMTSQILLF